MRKFATCLDNLLKGLFGSLSSRFAKFIYSAESIKNPSCLLFIKMCVALPSVITTKMFQLEG